METLNLSDLIAGINPELQAEMQAMQANKKGGGKSVAPLTDEERTHIRALVAACLLGHVSQRDIVKLYKESVHPKTDETRKKELKDLWFAPITARSGAGFEKKFVEIYKEMSGKDSQPETDDQKESA